MTTPKWEPGKTYLPGAVVVPRTEAPATVTNVNNAGFEDGATGWAMPAGWVVSDAGIAGRAAFEGTKFATYTGAGQVSLAESVGHAVAPGQTITLYVWVRMPGNNDTAGAAVFIRWLDAGNNFISFAISATQKRTNGNWVRIGVTGIAPSGAAFAVAGVSATINSGGGYIDVDGMAWSYSQPPSTAGLIYKAVQAGPGVSAANEPTWPTANGVQVVDNTVTWEAMTASYVEWSARPIMMSGATEPEWPPDIGATVPDGTMAWEAVSRRVVDAKLPQSKVVAIMASKVFAADGDIVRFSATANPLDWSTPDDAGYLPTGLQQANAADLAVLQPYRGNLCAWNASSFQMWQVDPDPAAMALLDQMDGVGSVWPLAAQAVGNDLYYLSQLGVRSVAIANAAENMQAGDVGMPIDPLVQKAISEMWGDEFIATYYPSAGQYWLARNIASGGEY
jgi:hypothetical protein